MDEAREERSHTRLYDEDLTNPKTRFLWDNPTGILMTLVKDACRGQGHFSQRCKDYLADGRICAEHSHASLAAAMGLSAKSVQRHIATLVAGGVLVVVEQGDGVFRSIFQVGYWVPIPLQNGEVKRAFRYYYQEPLDVGVDNSVQGRVDSSVTPRVDSSVQGGGDNSVHQDTEDSTAQREETTADIAAAPRTARAKAKPPGIRLAGVAPGKDDPRAPSRGAELARQTREQRAKAAPPVFKDHAERDVEATATRLRLFWNSAYKAKLGAAPTHFGSTTDLVRERLREGVTEEDFKALIEKYLEVWEMLGHEKPSLHRLTHARWWGDLYFKFKQGKPLIEMTDQSGATITEEDLKRIQEQDKKDGGW